MKVTDHFKNTINDHLQQVAANDSLFAETLKKANKNIDDCITYILNQVKKSGCFGFADEEIYNMAIHYYDEDDVKPGKKLQAKVVVNHTIGKKLKAEPVEKSVKKTKVVKMNTTAQVSLFDFDGV